MKAPLIRRSTVIADVINLIFLRRNWREGDDALDFDALIYDEDEAARLDALVCDED